MTSRASVIELLSERNAWQNPDRSLLGTGRRPPPRFPLELLKPFWGDWTTSAAKTASAPADYVGTGLLGNVSALLANVRRPRTGGGWDEPPVLWMALVGSPSSGKSPALDAGFQLLEHIEARMAEGFDEKQRKFETDMAIALASREVWQDAVKAAAKRGEPAPNCPPEAILPEPPLRPRIRVADCTTEKLGYLAAHHERGLMLSRDELAGWLGAFDRYGGGAGADRPFAIEMYGGRRYVIDRVKNREPVEIPHLSVSVLGSIQPDKLANLTAGPDDGLLARFLWCYPDNDCEFRLARIAPDHAAAKRALQKFLGLRMSVDDAGKSQPISVKLSTDAEDELEVFAREMQIRERDAYGVVLSAIGKARGHVLRLATVIEYLWWSGSGDDPEPEVISADAVLTAAALVGDYFLPMAERVFADAAIPKNERKAMAVAKRLRKDGLSRFNARDLRREMGGIVRKPADMDLACEALTEAGLIKPMNVTGPGRAPKNFEVNPIVFGSDA
jgi:hypothetical protein